MNLHISHYRFNSSITILTRFMLGVTCAFCFSHEASTSATLNRSLIAAYLLVLNGYTNVFHLEGGLYNWFKEGLPVVSEE